MKIFLTGYMGAGKSTTGSALAQKMNFKFLDLDAEIEEKEGKLIHQIFEKRGEVYFRKLENQMLQHFLNSETNFVMALGGGTLCYGNNLAQIQQTKNSKLIYLKLSAEALTKRLFSEKEQRPLICHLSTYESLLDFVKKHLFERNFYYNQSDLIIDVTHKTPLQIENEIVEALN